MSSHFVFKAVINLYLNESMAFCTHCRSLSRMLWGKLFWDTWSI